VFAVCCLSGGCFFCFIFGGVVDFDFFSGVGSGCSVGPDGSGVDG
jgi:hypothetical protein